MVIRQEGGEVSFLAGWGAGQGLLRMVIMLLINYQDGSPVVLTVWRYNCPPVWGQTGGLGPGRAGGRPLSARAQLVPSLPRTGPSDLPAHNGWQGKRNFLAWVIPMGRKQLALMGQGNRTRGE